MKRVRRMAAVAGLAGLAVASVAGAVVVQASVASAASFANGKDPVVFVHGYQGSGSNWGTMRQAFSDAGYAEDQLIAISYNSSRSNVEIASQIGQKVDEVLSDTGASKVDIVSHSMGSLNSRYCVKFDSCGGKVDDWISLAGANQGTTMARLCSISITCREMIPGSDVLTKLNSGAALPGGTDGTVFWTREDQVIQPATNSVLDGLNNVEVSGVTHLSIIRDAKVTQAVLDEVG